MMSRSTYNLKIDTICTYDIPLDRTFLKLSNGIIHVMPSTDRRLELKEKTSMAQTIWQPAVYAKGLIKELPWTEKDLEIMYQCSWHLGQYSNQSPGYKCRVLLVH